MTKEEIEATLALSPKVAAAIIKDQFRAKQTFETNIRGDKYFFLVDPTLTFPQEVLERRGLVSATGDTRYALKSMMEAFGEEIVRANMRSEFDWGVVGYDVIGPDSSFFELHVEPGYMQRDGRIRRGVDPKVMPHILLTLMDIKEQLAARVKRLVDRMATAAWWQHQGLLESGFRKQDWSPREGD